MNQQFGNNISTQKPTYDRVQSALGGPEADTLQVDESINSLGECVEFHLETVRALLRRLHPVTGDLSYPESACGDKQRIKVPLAQRVDNRRDELHGLTAEVQATIRALQI